jgi:hypothetical protein
VLISEIGLIATTNIAYALGPDYLWIASSEVMIALMNLLLIGGMTLVSILGLTVGKWVHNVGAILLMTLFGGMLVFVAIHAARADTRLPSPLRRRAAISLLSVNILGKLGLRRARRIRIRRDLRRRVQEPRPLDHPFSLDRCPDNRRHFHRWNSVRAVLHQARFNRPDLARYAGTQHRRWRGRGRRQPGFRRGADAGGRSHRTMQHKLLSDHSPPMVAGWDHLLPARFGSSIRAIARPFFSILVVGGSTLAFASRTILDVGHQEAFKLLKHTAGIFYALTYVVMFAIPLKDPSAPDAVRGAAFSGLAMTLLYIALSIFPIIEVKIGACSRENHRRGADRKPRRAAVLLVARLEPAALASAKE